MGLPGAAVSVFAFASSLGEFCSLFSLEPFMHTSTCLGPCGLFSTIQGEGRGSGAEVGQSGSRQGQLPSACGALAQKLPHPQQNVELVMVGRGRGGGAALRLWLSPCGPRFTDFSHFEPLTPPLGARKDPLFLRWLCSFIYETSHRRTENKLFERDTLLQNWLSLDIARKLPDPPPRGRSRTLGLCGFQNTEMASGRLEDSGQSLS